MMRLRLVVACVLLCAAQSALANMPLSVPEIALMLRSGDSSKAVLAELVNRRFLGDFEPYQEDQLKRLNASPDLIDALKSGKYKIAFTAPEPEERKPIARQPPVSRQAPAQQAPVVGAGQSQTEWKFKLPSEIEQDRKLAVAARAAERARYCAAHPVECETLEAAQRAQADAQSARSEAQQARSEADSLRSELRNR